MLFNLCDLLCRKYAHMLLLDMPSQEISEFSNLPLPLTLEQGPNLLTSLPPLHQLFQDTTVPRSQQKSLQGIDLCLASNIPFVLTDAFLVSHFLMENPAPYPCKLKTLK